MLFDFTRTILLELFYNSLNKAYMMKLVDMRGLKPRPFRGPGSTPGIGILYIFLYNFSFILIFLSKILI